VLFRSPGHRYVMQHVLDYDDKKFANVAKEDLKLTDKDEKEKKRDKVGLRCLVRGSDPQWCSHLLVLLRCLQCSV
jgi:hypothetical protein